MILSTSKTIDWLFVHFAIARRFARRFIAGETLEQTVKVVKKLNKENKAASLNYLGEKVEDEEGAKKVTEIYKTVLQRIKDEKLDANISVKSTHLGLNMGEKVFQNNLAELQEKAAELGLIVEVDMEDSSLTKVTLDVFHRLVDRTKNLRIALQAYLYQTRQDLKDLVEKGSSARLVKGAYNEKKDVAWPKKKDVDKNYSQLIEDCFSDKARSKGFYPAFGTHDPVMIEKAMSHAKGKDEFEFQMLLGVRRDWQKKLAERGFRLRVYVPFGRKWYPYFMRRLAERPANVLFMLRTLLSP